MQNKTKPPSILPYLLLGIVGVFLYQLWQDPKPPQSDISPDAPSPQEFLRETEHFKFPLTDRSTKKDSSSDNESDSVHITNIDNQKLLVKLDSLGGRIHRLYLKSTEKIYIPSKAISNTEDAFGEQNNALELTQGRGLDFQPHLYWRDNFRDNMANPQLNQALFAKVIDQKFADAQVRQVAYALNFRFKGHRLRLIKLYFFWDNELFFRQVTLLENREAKNFTLEYLDDNEEKKYGHLYFKVFSDLGPSVSNQTLVNNSNGKFFYYNSDLIDRPDVYNSGGLSCLPFYCASPDQDGAYSIYLSSPNTLDFVGTRSRYFFAYSEYLTPQNIALHRPDGFIYRNDVDTENGESQTTVFLNFALAAKAGPTIPAQDLAIQSANEFDAWNKRIRQFQKKRKDVLLIDQKIYIGPRSSTYHVFEKPDLMHAALNVTSINENIDDVMYSGFSRFFSSIHTLILYLLKLFHQLTGNYGVSIICIALLIKLVTFPLTQMQTNSMKKMSALKPEIDKINERFKKNAMEKQKKLMEVYKKHNINPARGCIPLLIQMPIFFSLFTVFSESIELWQSPFILWMKDLSAPDTLFVIPTLNINFNLLPIIMAGTQLLQQRHMNTPTNPQQKMLMNLMPIIMIVFFWRIPSGVTLYWTVQNIITFLWQEFSSRKNKKREVAK